LSFAVIVTKLFTVLQVAEAQSSTAICDAQFSWMTNSRGQNPCVVAAYMQGVCTGGAFTVSPLPLDTHYTGPTAALANPCQCSTVTYSLVSACGLCQERQIENWSLWSFNCTTKSIQTFPDGVPSGTSVPAWAYLDVVSGDTFNLVAAEADTGAPESSASASTPTGITSSASAGSISSAYHTSTASGSSNTPVSGNTAAKKSNVGAIAGGTVGGVVVLGLIAALVAFLVVRKRNATKSVTPSADGYGKTPLNSPPPMSQQHSTYDGNPVYADNLAYAERPIPRVYDPSDPSTYPQPPPTPTIHTTNPGPAFHPYDPQGQVGQYSGAPEV